MTPEANIAMADETDPQHVASPRADLERFLAEAQLPLFRYAYVLCGGRADAEDLTQDTLLRLVRAGDRVLEVEAPMAYARATMTNTFLSRGRKSSQYVVALEELPDRGKDSHEVEVTARQHLLGLLARLPRRQRAAIVLRYYLGASSSEISATLNCSEATARSLVHRGLRRLRVDPESREIR